jgi:hypothetical protein
MSKKLVVVGITGESANITGRSCMLGGGCTHFLDEGVSWLTISSPRTKSGEPIIVEGLPMTSITLRMADVVFTACANEVEFVEAA